MTIVERSVSMDCVDILGDSFLFGLHARSAPGLSQKRTEGPDLAAHRRKVSKTHLLPLSGDVALV
jgi:hypothetical protein